MSFIFGRVEQNIDLLLNQQIHKEPIIIFLYVFISEITISTEIYWSNRLYFKFS